MGTFGAPAANKVVSKTDVVLVVGCRLTSPGLLQSPNLIDPRRQTLIQLDVERAMRAGCFRLDLGLIGDARAVLTAQCPCRYSKRPAYTSNHVLHNSSKTNKIALFHG